MLGRIVDIIGLGGEPGKELILAIELKTSLTWQVIKQAAINQLIVDKSYCAVGTNPRQASLDNARRQGVGVLVVKGHNVQRVVRVPASTRPDNRPMPHYHKRCIEQLSRMQPGGIAGLPQMSQVPARKDGDK